MRYIEINASCRHLRPVATLGGGCWNTYTKWDLPALSSPAAGTFVHLENKGLLK